MSPVESIGKNENRFGTAKYGLNVVRPACSSRQADRE